MNEVNQDEYVDQMNQDRLDYVVLKLSD